MLASELKIVMAFIKKQTARASERRHTTANIITVMVTKTDMTVYLVFWLEIMPNTKLRHGLCLLRIFVVFVRTLESSFS